LTAGKLLAVQYEDAESKEIGTGGLEYTSKKKIVVERSLVGTGRNLNA
jgi:hypothetical protein